MGEKTPRTRLRVAPLDRPGEVVVGGEDTSPRRTETGDRTKGGG